MKRLSIIVLLFLVVALGSLFALGYFDGDSTDYLPKELADKIDQPNEDGEHSSNTEKDLERDDREDMAPIDTEGDREIKGKVAIIIDDLGYSSSMDLKLAEIEHNLTLAVLPFLDGTTGVIDRFKDVNNFELILHLPLEPISKDAYEENMMMVDMEREEIIKLLERAINDMVGVEVIGLNNHKGSEFTMNRAGMEILLTELKERQLFFVDSYTIGGSLGYEMSLQMGIPTARRDVFLDNADDKDSIRERLHELEEISKSRGYAIAIGHHKDTTLQVLQEEMPEMERRGIEFVFVSELLK